MVGVANGVANTSSRKIPNSNAFPGASSYLSKTLICPSQLRRGRLEKQRMKAPERQAWITADGEKTYEQRLAASKKSEKDLPEASCH